MSDRGKFIVFEGLDGCGKSTQAQNLVDRLNALGIAAHYTYEPTNDSIPGREARKVIRKETSLRAETAALLFVADRFEHITNFVLPAVERGETVVSDRYYFSNVAYQGLEMDKDTILRLNEMMIADRIQPDAIVFLDVPPEECLERINHNRQHEDLFDEVSKLAAVRDNYFEVFGKMKDREKLMVLDLAGLDAEAAAEKIWEAVRGVV